MLLSRLTLVIIIFLSHPAQSAIPYTLLKRNDELQGSVVEANYSFPIEKDYKIWNLRQGANAANIQPTQLKGQVFFPNSLPRAHSVPLILLLAGNHAGCREFLPFPSFGDYPFDTDHPNDQGECPEGKKVVENHRGYDFLGRSLAKQGYMVVSVDPMMLNRASGTDEDPTINTARGRLLLRTLEKIREWDSNAAASEEALGLDISGTVDFAQIGLMGHSRGGSGARIAANLLMTPDRLPVKELHDWRASLDASITAVLEVTPTSVLERGIWTSVSGLAWAIVAAGCEEDLRDYSYFTLAQRQSRVNKAPNYFINAYGATHRFFNSEWKKAEEACIGDQQILWDMPAPTIEYCGSPFTLILGSRRQQKTLEWIATAFFRGHVGGDADPNAAAVLKAQPEANDLKSPFEAGITNLNLASSVVLQPLDTINGILVDGKPNVARTMADHAAAQLSSFTKDIRLYGLPPNFSQLEADLVPPFLPRINPDIKFERAVVIPLQKSEKTSVSVPLGASDTPETPAGSQCTIHVDVARRDPCFINSPSAEKKSCPKPTTISVKARVGDSTSKELNLRSRYSIEFGPANDWSFDPGVSQIVYPSGPAEPYINSGALEPENTPAPKAKFWVTLIPISWETIALPCSLRAANEIVIEVSRPNTGETAATESFLYIGPVRRT